VVLETRATKDEILELYLNDVYLGQRGSYAIHGVAEASRVFFGKDVTNVSLAEAATIAGVIQAPGRHSPFAPGTRARDRRNVVLQAMADAGFVSQAAAERAGREPMQTVARARKPRRPTSSTCSARPCRTSTRACSPAPGGSTSGRRLTRTCSGLPRRQCRPAPPPSTSSSRANESRPGPDRARRPRPENRRHPRVHRGPFVRAVAVHRPVNARRQPGSAFKPFVYLAAFESAAADGRTDITPAPWSTTSSPPSPSRSRLDAAELRGRVRRHHHAAPRPRAVA